MTNYRRLNFFRRSPRCWGLVLLTSLLMWAGAPSVSGEEASDIPDTCYLFSYFIGNGADGLHLAWSGDGLTWEALNEGKSYLQPRVGKSKLMRDPCIIRQPDGTFHMVWTDSWDSRTIGYASSKDLMHWSEQTAVPVMEHEPGAKNCWAPEIVFDPVKQRFMVFWATTIPEKFTETWADGRDDNNHRIYVATTKDFETWTPTELFFDPGFNCIDSTLVGWEGKVYMIFKDERKVPTPMKNLRLAVARTHAGPYELVDAPITPANEWVEGPTTLRVGDYVYLYFDAYTRHHYGGLRSKDLKTWEDVTDQLTFPKGIRHGTALKVPGEVVRGLMDASRQAP